MGICWKRVSQRIDENLFNHSHNVKESEGKFPAFTPLSRNSDESTDSTLECVPHLPKAAGISIQPFCVPDGQMVLKL